MRSNKCKKLTQEDQVTCAPRAVSVSIKTAVWIVLDYELEADGQARLYKKYSHVKTASDTRALERLGGRILI